MTLNVSMIFNECYYLMNIRYPHQTSHCEPPQRKTKVCEANGTAKAVTDSEHLKLRPGLSFVTRSNTVILCTFSSGGILNSKLGAS